MEKVYQEKSQWRNRDEKPAGFTYFYIFHLFMNSFRNIWKKIYSMSEMSKRQHWLEAVHKSLGKALFIFSLPFVKSPVI